MENDTHKLLGDVNMQTDHRISARRPGLIISKKKWYMHNPAALLENDSLKLLWDFDIHTDHLISAWRLELIVINQIKRTSKIVDFAVLADHRTKLKKVKSRINSWTW